MKKKLLLAAAGIAIAAAAVIGIWHLVVPGKPSAAILTKQEAKKVIEKQLGGTVTSVQKSKIFYAKMEKRNQLYEIELDPQSGDILNLTKIGQLQEEAPPALKESEIEKIALANASGKLAQLSKTEANGKPVYKAVVTDSEKSTTLTIDAENGKVLSKTDEPVKAPPKTLTEAEAASIAEKQVNGELDDISLSSVNGQSFYLCEIKTPDGREATVQVHAITGEVMSVAWDDDDDRNDDDDGDD